jgi:hypothetical protein
MFRPSRKSSILLASAAALLCLCPRPADGAAGDYGRTVELPPFIAEDSAVPLRWRYAKFDQFEVLSICSDATTSEFIRQIRLLEEQLSWILPAQFRVKMSLPLTYILCNESLRKRLDQDIPVELYLNRDGQSQADSVPAASRPRLTVIPHLGLQDDDAFTTFMLVDYDFLQDSQLCYLPSAVETLLRRRTPPLPAWFIDGFMYLYGSMAFTPSPSLDKGRYWDATPDSEETVDGPSGTRVGVSPFVWVSDTASSQLRQKWNHEIKIDPGKLYAETPLLPMEDLLVAPHPPPGPSEAIHLYDRRWTCQAALFVRYALEDEGHGPLNQSNRAWRESFWRFLTRASAEPVTESMFRDCFGVGYEDMRSQLVHYLYPALFKVGRLGTAAHEPRPVPLRAATVSEVARIKGDWERLEATMVKKTYPGLSGAYLEHARHTLWHGYGLGERDPQLLAAMGLYECDAGSDNDAQPLLAAAVQAHVVRPKAYVELARILYAEDLAKPAGANGRLSAAQTGSIFEPLAEGWTQSPPMPRACELLADIWFHSEVAPSRADLAELEREALLFPESSHLISQIAVLDAQAGRVAEANQLIARGLDNAPDEPSKARLLRLRAALVAAK